MIYDEVISHKNITFLKYSSKLNNSLTVIPESTSVIIKEFSKTVHKINNLALSDSLNFLLMVSRNALAISQETPWYDTIDSVRNRSFTIIKFKGFGLFHFLVLS